MNTSSLRILVSGMMAGVPGYGGATWAVLQYVLGLRRMGHRVWFVEPVEGGEPEAPERFPAGAAKYFRQVSKRFGLEGEAALLHSRTRETVGVSYQELLRFAGEADLLLNLSGILMDPELLSPIPLRVYVDLDPAFTQLWMVEEGVDMGFDAHHRFVTVGLSVGEDDCPIPTCDRTWIPTLQPVFLEAWPPAHRVRYDALTTVANWRGYGSVEHGGVFHGQKAHSLRELIALPERAPADFLLALAIDEGDGKDAAALRAHGWKLADPERLACSPCRYQAFVRGSRAEFGVAKSGYVVSRSGWFSDRSACYLASGRPVLAQDTGFSRHLPVGRGLLAFDTEEDVLAGLEALREDYAGHALAARALAEAHFDSSRVLGRILEEVGGAVPATPPGDEEFRAELEVQLAEETRTAGGIRSVNSRPSRYGTSSPLRDVDLILEDGTRLDLFLKDASPGSILDEARGVKPAFLTSPSREIEVYRTLLGPRGVGPLLWASVVDEERQRYWLLLERVPGVELYQVGGLDSWMEVARWLGRFHARFQEDASLMEMAAWGRLLRYDRPCFQRWLDRALSFAVLDGKPARGRRALLERIRSSHERIMEPILDRPPTLVHGEFYASNVLVRNPRTGRGVVPVDWELTGVGPGLLDLAALVAGDWSEGDKEALGLAYHHAFIEAGGRPAEEPGGFLDALACSRLQTAVQWLGWARQWAPPPEHRRDWEEEASRLADRLQI